MAIQNSVHILVEIKLCKKFKSSSTKKGNEMKKPRYLPRMLLMLYDTSKRFAKYLLQSVRTTVGESDN